jgi:hypothetical protein
VAAPRRYKRENQDLVACGSRLDRGAFTGQSAADDQHVGADE